MKHIQVLGTGYDKCEKLVENAQAAVNRSNIAATVDIIADMDRILTFGVPTTPALVIDDEVKAVGRVPDVDEISRWLAPNDEQLSCSKSTASAATETGGCCCEMTVPAEVVVPCCGPAPVAKDWSTAPDVAAWIVDRVSTPGGFIPKISTSLTTSDRLGNWKARWGIHCLQHWVKPRLYAVGDPTCESPVFVSANYKMSFDQLRAALAGLDAWILVLDTKGINVWCAAGKGTFGTDELVRQIERSNLSAIVQHNRVIVPQLGAPGVAAHEVRTRSGFRVVYGPVRAADIPAFLAARMKATPQMRQVEFPLGDRLAVVPLELMPSAAWAFLIAAVFLLLGGWQGAGYSWSRSFSTGLFAAALFLLAYAFGTILTPAVLPWLPFRPLAVKGFWTGIVLCVAAFICNWHMGSAALTILEMTAVALVIVATASFMAMKFTGSTTYTSLSGVRREMRLAVPLQAVASVSGVVLYTLSRFM